MPTPTRAVAIETAIELKSWRPKSQISSPLGSVRVEPTTSRMASRLGSWGRGRTWASTLVEVENARLTTHKMG